jgi:raffinose/stachyose/melibiose transport system permease protein
VLDRSRSSGVRSRWLAAHAPSLTAYLLITPAALLYGVFQLIAIVMAFVLSFTSWNGINFSRVKFNGIANYRRLLHDSFFWESLWHNVIVSVLVFVFISVGAFLVAAIIHSGIRWGGFFRIVFFAPVVVSSVAVAMLGIFFFSPSQGIINEFLGRIGLASLEQPWLGSPTWALPSVAVTYILQNFGFSVVLYLSALTQVNQEMCEAAQIDGASQALILWRVVLPTIRPAVSVVVLLGFVSSFRLFDTVYVMTSGGPFHASDTLVTFLYSTAFGGDEVGYANAIGVVLFLILCLIAAVQALATRAGASAQ